MLTGKIPFKGETISDTLANILQTNPNWQALPQSTPANIVVLLRRCLEKNPCRRLRDIGDAGIEIHDTLSLPVTESPTSSPTTIKSRSTLWRLGIACSLVGLIVGLIAANLFLSRPTAPSLSEREDRVGMRCRHRWGRQNRDSGCGFAVVYRHRSGRLVRSVQPRAFTYDDPQGTQTLATSAGPAILDRCHWGGRHRWRWPCRSGYGQQSLWFQSFGYQEGRLGINLLAAQTRRRRLGFHRRL